jgi:hypothetical protein
MRHTMLPAEPFTAVEERWFSDFSHGRRRPVRPAPRPAAPIGDALADKWFK